MAGLIEKIFTALRGGAREAGEAIVDANATRIFEQEIVDAETNLAKAKQDLTLVMAKEMQAGREIARLQKEINEHEGYAAQALAKNNEALALEIAQRIADLSSAQEEQQTSQNQFQQHTSRLREMIRQTEKSLGDMRRQLVMVKTTDSVQKATAAISDNFTQGTSKLNTARESLERIRQRQQEQDDRLKAGQLLQAETNGGDLQAKLREAGIGAQANAANDILARIKAKSPS